jgi:cytochrome c553
MKSIYKASYILTAIFQLMILSSCSESDNHHHPGLISGKDFFEHHCADCHSDSGKGLFLKGVPANIMTQMSENELIFYLKDQHRKNDSEMPVFANMPEQEARKIAAYLLQLKKDYITRLDTQDPFLLERQDKK